MKKNVIAVVVVSSILSFGSVSPAHASMGDFFSSIGGWFATGISYVLGNLGIGNKVDTYDGFDSGGNPVTYDDSYFGGSYVGTVTRARRQ